MEEMKKELAEIKDILLQLLKIQTYDHKMKYGYFEQIKENAKNYTMTTDNKSFKI